MPQPRKSCKFDIVLRQMVFDKFLGSNKEESKHKFPTISPPPLITNRTSRALGQKRYLPGEKIAGRYEVVKMLVGGMGLVYLCADHETQGLPVALKTFKPKYLADRATRDRFLQEGTVWVGLGHHPNIVRAYRVERLQGGLEVYLVLEWVAQAPGKEDASLRAWLQAGRPLETAQALRVGLHVARGMAHTTRKIAGLVHRDLKPENVLVGRDGLARVTDFGLVGVVHTSRRGGRAGVRGQVGTPLYMAPEQWAPGETIDQRADIYAFGCILFEMLTGHTAAAGTTADDFGRAHRLGRLRPFPDELPTELKILLKGCLALNPADRFVNWADVEKAVTLVYQHLLKEDVPALEDEPDDKIDAPADQVAAGWSYDAMGLSYRDIGNSDLAAGYFERVMWIGRMHQNRALEASGLSHLGDACRAMGDLEGAITYYGQQLDIVRELDDIKGECDALGNLGRVYVRLGQLDQTAAYYEKQLDIAQETDDQRRIALALHNFGNLSRLSDDPHQAIKTCKRALRIVREQEDRLREGRILGDMGLAYTDLNRVEQAIACYKEALTIAKETGDRAGEGFVLGYLGKIYHRQNDIKQALWHYINQLSIAQETHNRPGEAAVSEAIGDLYIEMESPEQAIESFQTTLTIARDANDKLRAGRILKKLGVAFGQAGQVRRSIGFFEEAVTWFQLSEDVVGRGDLFLRLANAYRDTGDSFHAEQNYERALSVARQLGDEHFRAVICYNFALALAQADNQPEALHYAELAEFTFKQEADAQGLKQARALVAKLKKRRWSWF